MTCCKARSRQSKRSKTLLLYNNTIWTCTWLIDRRYTYFWWDYRPVFWPDTKAEEDCDCNKKPEDLTLGEAQGIVFNCLHSLQPEASWSRIKAALRQKFSLVLQVTHAAKRLMNKYQEKGETLQEFNLEFSKIAWTITKKSTAQITNPLKTNM